MPSPSIVRLATAVACCFSALAYGGNNELLGCWKGEDVVQFFPDGKSVRSTPKSCLLEFGSERIRSSCGDIGYTYRVVRAGVYTATMISHGSRPDLIGGTREYEYRIEDGRLFITTYPQTTKPAPLTQAIRVESKSLKVECP